MKKKLLVLMLIMLSYARVDAQEWLISTNFLDWAELGTMNVEAGYGFARHWSVGVGAKYNPFMFAGGAQQEGFQMKQRSLSASMRFWPWHIYSGWWLSGRGKWQEFSEGGILSPQTSEGDRYGFGLSGGYSYMLGKHVNLDVGIGMWGGKERYVLYSCPSCGRTQGSGERYFMLPDDVMLTLSYVF